MIVDPAVREISFISLKRHKVLGPECFHSRYKMDIAMDHFDSVPKDVLQIIINYCPITDYKNIANTCKRFRSLIKIDLFWRDLALQRLTRLPYGQEYSSWVIELLDITKWKKICQCTIDRKSRPDGFTFSPGYPRFCIIGEFRDRKCIDEDGILIDPPKSEIILGKPIIDGEGQGILMDKHGNVYDGSFVDFAPHGDGKMRYKNNIRYHGYFHSHMINGKGQFSSNNSR